MLSNIAISVLVSGNGEAKSACRRKILSAVVWATMAHTYGMPSNLIVLSRSQF